MGGRYASKTIVGSSASRDEIERTLTRYGATGFAYGWDRDRAVIGFVVNNRKVQFSLPMPDRSAREFTHTPEAGLRRSEDGATKAFEQAVRQRWRALALVIKAKLEAVTAQIVTFDDEFAMHMILPDGKTVRDHVIPEIERAYATGVVRPFLAIGSAS